MPFDYHALPLDKPTHEAIDRFLEHLSRYPGKTTPVRAGYVRRWLRTMAREIAEANANRLPDRIVSTPKHQLLDDDPEQDVPEPVMGQGGPSLLRFLTSIGGLRDNGDLRAMDAHKKFVPGGGMLMRRDGTGRSLDYARSRAAECGFLSHDSDVNDLLNAINEELHGRRQYAGTHADAGAFSTDCPF